MLSMIVWAHLRALLDMTVFSTWNNKTQPRPTFHSQDRRDLHSWAAYCVLLKTITRQMPAVAVVPGTGSQMLAVGVLNSET